MQEKDVEVPLDRPEDPSRKKSEWRIRNGISANASTGILNGRFGARSAARFGAAFSRVSRDSNTSGIVVPG
jgi:hypothetical protein